MVFDCSALNRPNWLLTPHHVFDSVPDFLCRGVGRAREKALPASLYMYLLMRAHLPGGLCPWTWLVRVQTFTRAFALSAWARFTLEVLHLSPPRTIGTSVHVIVYTSRYEKSSQIVVITDIFSSLDVISKEIIIHWLFKTAKFLRSWSTNEAQTVNHGVI